MSTQPIEANHPLLTEVPQRILFVPPAPTTPYELRLVHWGLTKQAIRAAVNRVLKKFYNSARDRMMKGDIWPVPRYTQMLRSDPHHAGELAKHQEVHYHPFRHLSKSQFVRFDFQILAMLSCEEEIVLAQKVIKSLRRLLSRVLADYPTLDKIGTARLDVQIERTSPTLMDIRIKVLVAGKVDEGLRRKLTAALPLGTDIVGWHAFDKEQFAAELRLLTASDLPARAEKRADFERLLRHMEQISLRGVSNEVSSQFALTPESNANLETVPATDEAKDDAIIAALPVEIVPELGKIVLSHIPRSPRTGKLARWVSIPVSADTSPDDLRPEEWLEIVPPS